MEYELIEDICKECEELYYLSVDKTKCESFPSGIFRCVQYINKDLCGVCADGYYLLDNKCA